MEPEVKSLDEAIELIKELMDGNKGLMETAQKMISDMKELDIERLKLNNDLEQEIRLHNIIKRQAHSMYNLLSEARQQIAPGNKILEKIDLVLLNYEFFTTE